MSFNPHVRLQRGALKCNKRFFYIEREPAQVAGTPPPPPPLHKVGIKKLVWKHEALYQSKPLKVSKTSQFSNAFGIVCYVVHGLRKDFFTRLTVRGGGGSRPPCLCNVRSNRCSLSPYRYRGGLLDIPYSPATVLFAESLPWGQGVATFICRVTERREAPCCQNALLLLFAGFRLSRGNIYMCFAALVSKTQH